MLERSVELAADKIKFPRWSTAHHTFTPSATGRSRSSKKIDAFLCFFCSNRNLSILLQRYEQGIATATSSFGEAPIDSCGLSTAVMAVLGADQTISRDPALL